jgi:hypothetical protein
VIHICKFSWLYEQQNRVSFASTLDSKKFVLNLLKHSLTDPEGAVLVKGHILDMARAVELFQSFCRLWYGIQVEDRVLVRKV